MRRIKTEGPKLEDVTETRIARLKKEDGTFREYPYKWVPKEVITASGHYVTQEPDWQHLPQMAYMDFYQVSCHLIYCEVCSAAFLCCVQGGNILRTAYVVTGSSPHGVLGFGLSKRFLSALIYI